MRSSPCADDSLATHEYCPSADLPQIIVPPLFSASKNKRSSFHVKLPTERSNFSRSLGSFVIVDLLPAVRSEIFPDCRSWTKSRHLSASKPARACERQARYFPSGE